MSSPLTDLDELVLLCRNSRAKAYIQEAVASYRVGAIRASIVATWVAVCFDFIEKLHELSLAGDREAEQLCAHLEKVRSSGDVRGALQFEAELLILAKSKFEWLSPIEFTDLERLRVDRNRCAHPSLVEEGRFYTPTGELARLHIKNAVVSVLQHPPAQGKYALDRLMRDITSEYFPTKVEDAKVTLEAGPLKKARESLIRNFIVVLLKMYLFQEEQVRDKKSRARIIAALKATAALHPSHFDCALRDKVNDISRNVEDVRLLDLVRLLSDLPDIWQHLAEDMHKKINNFVINLPGKHFGEMDLLLPIPQLNRSAEIRVKSATVSDICESFFFVLLPPIVDRCIELYLRAPSFDVANRLAKEMIGYADDFSNTQICELIKRAHENKQVVDSFHFGPLLSALRNQKAAPENFDDLLAESKLEEYVAEKD